MFLIAGATSAPGRAVVTSLLERGHAVRVLVRGERDATDFAARGCEVVRGDVRDDGVAASACRGARVVVSMIGRHFAATAEGLWQVDVEGNETLIESARVESVERFALLSALWADRDYPPVLLAAKRAAEAALVASKLPHTIVRPSTFTLGASSLVGFVGPTIERWGVAFIPETKPISFVARADVAAAVVAAALDTHPARVVELGGPEALTMDEGARRVAAVLGKKLRIIRVPRSVVAAMRSIVEDSFAAYESALFTEMLCDHGYHCEPGPARELLGREPTPVDAEVRAYYATTKRTPWAESNFGVYRNRSR